MIRFFTAAFGEPYKIVGRGLAKSFQRYSPKEHLTVFTDLNCDFYSASTVRMDFAELLMNLDSFYQTPNGQFRCVFKFNLFQKMREAFPTDDLCWIDADMLVLSDISEYLTCGSVNVMAHGRRDLEVLDCGGGLFVRGDRYAIGGLFALPPGPAIDFLINTSHALPTWDDGGGPLCSMADQVILNHLVAYSGLPIKWITDDRRYIFNLEVSDSAHPVVGDSGLAGITLNNSELFRADRQIAIFCWIKNKFDAHLMTRFMTFQPDVANFLRDIYLSS